MTVIKNLLLALLNATIMLLIILAVAGIIILGQVEDLADAVHEELATPMAELGRIADGVEGIRAEIAAAIDDGDMAGITVDLDLLRQELAAVNDRLAALGDVTAEKLVTELGQTISERLVAAPETGGGE